MFSQHSIIPMPVEYNSYDKTFLLNSDVKIDVQFNDARVLQYVGEFKEYLKSLGITLNSSSIKSDKTIIIANYKTYNSELSKEGYTLHITDKAIRMKANTSAGIFYAFQTLKQLLPIQLKNLQNKNIKIRACSIKDYPRFAWRGLMLDVSRHFFTVDELKAFIDKMAQYKFNVFHWHLTDDNGWRIEIKSLPKLTEIGAWRVQRYGRFGSKRKAPQKGEAATYGGFYTHEQIKDIVKYALHRNITIVPEIDMPGHSMAALAAYPELSTDKEAKQVNPGSKFSEWYSGGRFKMLIENMLNPTDEQVYIFADKVFKEVANLFPGQYIHMGGDECYHGYWEKNKSALAFMKKHDIKNGHQLQAYFVNRIYGIINKYGKKMIGWDEILDGNLNKETVVMSWRGMKHGIRAAKKGYKVVMSPNSYAYLDYTQGDHSVENPIYANLSLEKTYEFEPLPPGIKSDYILGGQGNLWTEAVPNLQFAFYMTYPRAFAISESLWSKKGSKNWNSFIKRTEAHFIRFDKTKTNICKAIYEPIVKIYKKNGKIMCKLENNVPDLEIFYTIDNTYPVKFGIKYSKPFEIHKGELNLRTQSYRNGKAIGRELILNRTELIKRALRVKN